MNPPSKEKNSITRYDIIEEVIIGCTKRPKKSFDLLSVIMLYLGEAYRDSYDDIIGLLSPLLSNQMPQNERCNVLEEKYEIAMKKERDVSDMCNLSKGVWEDGIQQGVLDSIINLMKNLDFNMEQAMNALGISDNDKPEYEEMLRELKK
jgi:hypothetical protein